MKKGHQELPNPPADAVWRQYRYDTVTRLVNRLVEVVHQKGKQVTAAVFPTPSIARKLVRQDWAKWEPGRRAPDDLPRFLQ